jgi:protein involved in polysaccharide export with SLBB domain
LIRKIQTLFILITSLSISAQVNELDSDYFESLPDEMKSDVLDTMQAKEELEKPIYRKASTAVDKKDKEDLSDESKEDDRLYVFGKTFFDTIQSTFMPLNEPNFDGSYVLDYGDVLEIQITEQRISSDKYEIKRDGSIQLKEIGKISIAGLSLEEAGELIKSRVKDVFTGTEAFISLINVRDIQVVVTGNAFNPGIYSLSGNSNVFYALSMAGGLSEDGSYRQIEHIRNNNVIDSIDLYSIFIRGYANFKNRLQSGDIILVKPRLNIVNAISGVKRPGLYEMKDGESYSDLISYANGLHSNANLDFIKIQSIEKGKLVSNTFESAKELYKIKIKHNDNLIIDEFKLMTVKLNGAIKFPGTYITPLNMPLSQLIEQAGGYQNNAYPFGGFLNNETAMKVSKDAKNRTYKELLRNIIDIKNISDSSGTSISMILKELKEAKDVGRIIVEFDLDVIKSKPEFDTILEDGDEITIPFNTNQVYVYGETNNSGSVRYEPNANLSYYINNSGGLRKTAEKKAIFLVQPNGHTKVITMSSKLGNLISEKDDVLIYPGSLIFVPKTTDITDNTALAAIWAPILSSFALSAASIASLKN